MGVWDFTPSELESVTFLTKGFYFEKLKVLWDDQVYWHPLGKVLRKALTITAFPAYVYVQGSAIISRQNLILGLKN
jgi:hypothetical protein